MEFLNITATGWSSLLSSLSIVFLSLMMFILGKTRMHYLWGIFNLTVALWAGAFYVVTIATTPEDATLWWKISYIGVILIPFTFYHFVLEFINIPKFNAYKHIKLPLLYSLAIILVLYNINSNAIIGGVRFLFGEFYYGQPGYLHPYFFIFYIALVSYAFFLLAKGYQMRKEDPIYRQQTLYLTAALIIAFTGGSLNFLPIYGIDSPPISNAAVVLGAALAAYATLRYRLLNVRIVTAQFLTLTLVIFSLVRLVLSSSVQELIFNVLILTVTFIVGVYLIFSVRKEVEQREQIQKLAAELQVANEQQMVLIHFITHQVKGFLTLSRNIFSLLLEDTYGELNPKMRSVIQQGFDNTTKGVYTVQDVLLAANVKKGTMKYSMQPLELRSLIEGILSEVAPRLKEKNLTLGTVFPAGSTMVSGDQFQLHEVFKNLIDNAIRYTPAGTINVRMDRKVSVCRVEVKDSGVGITPEDRERLFTEGGRGKESLRVNVDSTGYGLFIAKGIVNAHGGKVWAESAGAGQGSTFIVELPLLD